MPQLAHSGRTGIWHKTAWIPIPLCILLTLWMAYTREDPPGQWALLIASLAFLFSTTIAFFVAWLANRSYRLHKSKPVLCLGMSAMGSGYSSVFALVMLSSDLNLALVIYISGILAAGLCHCAAAIIALRPAERQSPSSPALHLFWSYLGVVALLTLIAITCWRGLIPPVFVKGLGTTWLWQLLLVVAALLFAMAAILLRESHRRTRSEFLYIYALALAITATGLACLTAIPDVRSASSWASRTTLYLGGAYLLGAVLTAMHEAGGWGVALQSALSETRKRYDVLFNSSVEGVVIQELSDEQAMGSIIAVNPAVCEMLGFTPAELIQSKLIDRVEPTQQELFQQKFKTLFKQGTILHEKTILTKNETPLDTEIDTHLFESEGKQLALSIIRNVTERKQAQEALRAAQEELRVSEARKAQEIMALNLQLEQRVAERTKELQAANKELEAFSYSVSHDLRAPLRSIVGFSRIVLEDFGAQLPERALHYQKRVYENAQRMGELIDDLLSFSRLGRQPLTKQSVHPEALVRDVLKELQAEQQARTIAISIGSLPACQADLSLLRQVFVNLLSNALKYTRKTADAQIQIGADQENGETVYWIKDNGAGFNMKFADKLFGVFQRLHRSEEFEGTGLGLALTQRIIQRHGGRIWATAQLGEGATFYFTLQEEGAS